MANKNKKGRERKIEEETREQQVKTQKPGPDMNQEKMPGQEGPGALSERGADRSTKGKARP